MSAAFTQATKTLVFDRCRGLCEKCGTRIFNGVNYHHRRARGMGSTKRPESASAANCLVLHPSCHEYIERNRAESLDNGWLVRQSDDPRTVPVFITGVWTLLNEDGTVTTLSAGAGRGSPRPH